MENEKHPLDDLKMTKSLKNVKNEKCNTEGPGIWRKLKITEMRNTHFRDGNMARKTEKVENLEMSTVGRGIWQENWKIMENEKHPLDDLKMTKSLKYVKNEKCTLKDLEYGEN